MTRRVIIWVALAALGVVLAAGVTVAATRIAGSHITLSSEPNNGGGDLAPPRVLTVPAPPARGDDGRGHDD